MALEVRAMGPGDLDFALALTREEGWAYGERDIIRLLELEPGGSFVALEGGERVGMVTTLRHGRSAWLGNLVVRSGYRGLGYGKGLVVHALASLAAKGHRTVGIYAYEWLTDFYRYMGFEGDGGIITFSGPGRGGRGAGDAVDVDELVAFDTPRFGDGRGKLLRRLAAEFPDLCKVQREGGCIAGYIMGRRSYTGAEIGPWVSHPSSSRGLLEAELAGLEGEVWISVPEKNGEALETVHSFGFRERFRTVLMYRGPPLAQREICAVAALEKG
ncbi:MAG: GNAT family N-acetyltransferase [Euryarchaeota archaeon]|nr:GNAT family N-acetyltransferase [Euryarchaeota archaeon]